MRSVCLFLQFALYFLKCTAIAKDEKKPDYNDGHLFPNGSHVCSYKETRPVQVNASFIDVKTVPIKIRYKTYVWGVPYYRTRTVMKEMTSIGYYMQTKMKDFDVYYCCSGWTHTEGGKDCDKPVCAIGCDNGGQCTAPDTCTCKSGFEGEFCQNDINECTDINKNTCEQRCFNTRGSFECFCNRGFKRHPENPNNCVDINECVARPCRCQPGDVKCQVSCINTGGSYKCLCGKGYKLYPDGTCRDMNECIQNVCSQRCVNLPGSYRCECLPGFELNKTNDDCMDINECEIKNGGCNQKCHNVEGGYVCSCDENYFLGDDRKTCKAMENATIFTRLCDNDYQNYAILACWPGKVQILAAFYGRVSESVCNAELKSYKTCSVDGITQLLRKKCLGQDTCFLDASKDALTSLKDPCPDVSKYVEVYYKCAHL